MLMAFFNGTKKKNSHFGVQAFKFVTRLHSLQYHIKINAISSCVLCFHWPIDYDGKRFPLVPISYDQCLCFCCKSS